MTEYFEVLERDGAARVGELRLSDPLTTPGIVDPVLEDAGSLWVEDRPTPAGDPDALTVLPHRGFPAGTDERVVEAFAPAVPDIEAPSAAVIAARQAADLETDAYVLASAAGLDGNARALHEAIVRTRTGIPDDAALYLPGIASAATAPLLAYTGVDLVDTHRAVIDGTRGRYHTRSGSEPLESLSALPCACPVCQRGIDEFDRTDCADHNVSLLRSTLALIRDRIRAGRLRDYLEGQVRHSPWMTACFRTFDQEHSYLEERAPLYRAATMAATTEDALDRVAVTRFTERVTEQYRNRFDVPLVLVPCSASKPYSESKSHGHFRSAIDYRGHRVALSSPVGVVPQELELTYPAQHYDAAVSGRWTPGEIEFISDLLDRYLDRNRYDRIIAHVPAGGYREICERVASRRGVDVTYTVADHPTDDESLEALAAALADEPRYRKGERQRNTIRAIADYQFGPAAGDELFPELSIQSRYPKLRAHDADGTQLAAMVPEYGTLALTIAGAERWVDSPVPTKVVEIDEFVPHGSVLAPGIRSADPEIRVGDEVIVRGPAAFGVGRAVMFGSAMTESTRGVAVDMRHVRER